MFTRPLIAGLTALVIMITAALSVPAVRAEVQDAFYGWSGFSIPNSTDYLSIQTEWGFTPYNPTRMPKELKLKASMTGGDTSTTQLGLCYQPDQPQPSSPFVAILQTVVNGERALPKGESLKVRGLPGNLETNVQGQIPWCMEPISFQGANRLTWYEKDLKIEITGTFSEHDLLVVANSLRQAEVSTGTKPPNQ